MARYVLQGFARKPAFWQMASAETIKSAIEPAAPSSTVTIGLSRIRSTESIETVKEKLPLRSGSISAGTTMRISSCLLGIQLDPRGQFPLGAVRDPSSESRHRPVTIVGTSWLCFLVLQSLLIAQRS
jgi:hypothetical protein